MAAFSKFWGIILITFIGFTGITPPVQAEETSFPVTGNPVPSLAAFESDFVNAMQSLGVPGASVAIMKDGKLLYARGFGYAHRYENKPVEPDNLFRLASVSKIFTAIAIMKLVEQKRLSLEDKAFEILKTKPFPGADVDPRLYQITIHNLLNMRSGMVRSINKRRDLRRIMRASGERFPPSREAFLRYMMGLPLAFDPGTEYKYSNAGYNVLAHVVEKVSGQPFEEFVRKTILNPLSMPETKLGHTLYRDRDPQEVHYYMPPGTKKFRSIFPEIKRKLACPYGGCFYLESQFGSGAWLSTAPELVKVFSAIGNETGLPRILSQETVTLMEQRPRDVSAHKKGWYGLGWDYNQFPEGVRMSKNGSLPGTTTWIFKNPEGVVVAGLFNIRFSEKEKDKDFYKTFVHLLLRAGHEVIRKKKD